MASGKPSRWLILKNEESTHAITPDKMDRTCRIPLVIEGEGGKYQMPYPLTEEEATPQYLIQKNKLIPELRTS